MTGEPKEIMIERAASAFRERSLWGRIQPSPAWWDLAPEEREEVHLIQMESRRIEAALDPRGRSGTVRAVLDRIAGPPAGA